MGRDAEHELAPFFELSLDLLCIAGTDGFFKRLNPAFTRTLGYSRDELLGKPFIDFVYPDDREGTLAEVGKLASGATTVEFENRYLCRDGSYRTLSWNAAPSESGELIYAVAHDVTARHEVARKLAATATRARTVLQTAIDGIIVIDERGTIETFNAAAERIFGVSAERVVGENVRGLMAEPHRSMHDGYLERYHRTGSARVIGLGREVEGMRPDGTRIPLELAVSEMWIDGRRFYTGITRDISERKAVEQLKREFVSTVSHELRTPLTSIRGSLRLLQGGVAGELPKKASELVDIAASNSERLIRLINDMLDLDKIEAGRLELRLEPVCFDALIEQAMSETAGFARERRVTLVARDCSTPPVAADRDRLVQVLVNLLSNAIKFSASGASVTVSCSKPTERSVRVSVADTGPGIADEDRGRLFDKFSQADTGDARAKGGTGLGLAICKAIVTEHGGTIGVDAEVGRGSTFWFELVSEPGDPTEPLSAPPSHGRVVLVVGAGASAARALGSLLDDEGYRASFAHSIDAARTAAKRERPAAVLLALSVPDGDAFELLETLRDDPVTAAVPVIALHDGASDDEYGGVMLVDWMAKPADGTRLVRALRQATRGVVRPRVLVVDDDDDTRRVVTEILGPLGVECVDARDGRSAVRQVRMARPDLIILDVGLPDLDGFAVVEILRAEAGRHIPLLVYTGRDLDAGQREALTLGVTRHLTKTRTTEPEFVSAVRSLLGGLVDPAFRAR